MGRKSSSQDKGEGAADKAKGRINEAAGAITGDDTKKSEGRSDQGGGTVKVKKGKLKDLLNYTRHQNLTVPGVQPPKLFSRLTSRPGVGLPMRRR